MRVRVGFLLVAAGIAACSPPGDSPSGAGGATASASETTTATGGSGGSPASTGSSAATCSDGQKNGDEVGTDCGGSCAPCGTGVACTGAGDCASGHCTDGVCCDAACDGACVACAASRTGEADGHCAPVKAGTDPDGECQATDAATCGATGEGCNGDAGAPGCKVHPEGTECKPASCDDGKMASARACDGAGSCLDALVADCTPKQCAPGGKACLVACASNQDCVVGFECQLATGTCKPQGNTGKACEDDDDCSSGNCSDGVCCNLACGGGCDACAKSKGATVDGACTVRPTGATGSPSCSPYVCSGMAGECPSQCTSDMQCAMGHYCDAGACQPKKAKGVACALGKECTSSQCSDGVCCDKACSGACDVCKATLGASQDGTCTALPKGSAGEPTCSPYVCDGNNGTCPVMCFFDADCIAGDYCSNFSCKPKKAVAQTCNTSNECGSGFCADGRCCGSACNGNCSACNIAGSEGTCAFVIAGTDPGNDCLGHCDGAGGCLAPNYVLDVQPMLAMKCGACHTNGNAGGTNFAMVYADLFKPSNACQGLNVGQCSWVRILDGSMPKNKNCTGNPDLDKDNSACLTATDQAMFQLWLGSGMPQ